MLLHRQLDHNPRRGRLVFGAVKARIALAGAVAALVCALSAASAQAAIVPNPWLERNFLNIAHQGGEDESPSNTMYALKSAVREGKADMLEIDVQLTADGHLVVTHDDTYTRTSCLPALCPGPDNSTEPQRPASQIRDMTLAEVQALDAGYWFRPGTYAHDYALPDSAYPFRGMRTGAKKPSKGYAADDFRMPTLTEVFKAFPHTPINIEIKMPKSYDPPRPYSAGCGNGDGMPPGALCDDLDLTKPTTRALADFLNGPAGIRRPTAKAMKKYKRCVRERKQAGSSAKGKAKCKKPARPRRDDIIVVSFAQEPMVEFAAMSPQIHRAPSQESLLNHVVTQQPLVPDPVAFQVPPTFSGLRAPQILLAPPYSAHENGYAVHVWTNGEADETVESYSELVSLGIDGIMTTSPRKLNAFLCSFNVPHPNGTSRCGTAKKKKKPKKKGKKKRRD
jgi:glycerophosphoryl diester phosphodiesterase